MKRFLMIYAIFLVLSFVFVCFGARFFFGNIYLTTAAVDIILAIITALVVSLAERIDKLEERINELETKEK